MIDFWFGAAALLLVALAFLLLPVVRGRRAQTEEDRTALNVALYEERVQELSAQREAGSLETGQFDVARAEAARELLDDTEGGELKRFGALGRGLPLIAALLVPVAGIAMYWHWGALDRVQLAREFSTQPQTMQEMLARLERAVEVQPDNAEAWYFLGRTYMSQERPEEAAQAFEQTVRLAGRQPDLLGQWAQALYFGGGRQWTEQLQEITREALHGDRNETTTLGLMGIAAFEERRFADAMEYWGRLVALLPEQDPSRAAIQGGIERARAEMGEARADDSDETVATETPVLELEVQLSLAPEVLKEVRSDDTVFVFARGAAGPPMPLAVKRLTVAELPTTVTLSDRDAMMPELRLSNFDQIRLAARISRAGDATRGEWRGESDAVTPSAGDTLELSIDTADTP
ncbi:c-type cytochrome biogenesis protein CcmI [Stutzerimonas tarimensis]|uniref:C-type cytochrome biogenesis protein CcmI n=1 Tax=Stutzerimonas tarimensis TaxID=1507735 RepID=A0ABV7T8Q0_9GAMM